MAEQVDFQDFKLNIEEIGSEVDRGSFAAILELKYRGLKCVGKKLHSILQTPSKSSHPVKRYLEECQLLIKARHPNIVQFLGICFEESSELPILVMEFIPTNLTKCLECYGIFPDEISFSILYDVSLGLAYLHGQTPPIVHRDLSGSNILLSSNMAAKIADLGVARILNLTPLQMTEVPGTPAYMPPEVMVANPHYDTSIDQFSFGILMIQAFTATWPNTELGPTQVDFDSPDKVIGVSEIQRRKTLLKCIGEEHPLMDLIKRCLNNNPNLRPNAPEVVRRLSDIVLRHPPSFKNRVEMLRRISEHDSEKNQLQQEVETKAACVQQSQKQIESLKEEYETKHMQYEDEIDDLKQGHAIERKQLQEKITAQQISSSDVSETKAQLVKQLAEKKDQEAKIFEMQSKISENECKLSSLEEELVDTISALNSAKEDLIQIVGEVDQLKKQLADEHGQHSRKMIDSQRLVQELQEHMRKLQDDIVLQETELKLEKSTCERQESRIKSLETLESQLTETREYLTSKRKPLQATLSFTRHPDMPTATSAGQCVNIDDCLYYSGIEFDSKDSRTKKCDIHCYTIGLKKWSKLPQHPTCAQFSLGHINRQLVAIGGWNCSMEKASNKIVHVHHRRGMKKLVIRDMSTPRHSPMVVSLPSCVVVAGGIVDQDDHYTDIVEIYNIGTAKWSQAESMPKLCSFQIVGIVKESMYVIGNRDENSRLNEMFCTSLDQLLSQGKDEGLLQPSIWRQVANTPAYCQSAIIASNIVLAMGGYKTAKLSNFEIDPCIYAYSPTLNSWIKVGELPSPMANLTVASLPTREFITIGGFNTASHPTKTVYNATFDLSIR